MSDRLTELMVGYSEPLTLVVLGYGEQALVGTRILPVLPFPTLQVQFPKFGYERMRLANTKRALRGEPKTIEISWTYISATLDERALGHKLDWREMHAAATGAFSFDALALGAQAAKSSVQLGRESDIATLLQTTGSYASGNYATVSSGAGWNETTDGVSNVNPMDVIDSGMETIRTKTGRRPNVFWCGRTAWRAILKNTNVKAHFFGTTSPQGRITEAMVADELGLDEIVVGDAVYYNDSDTQVDLWGDYAGLVIRDKGGSAANPKPCFGFTGTLTLGQAAGQDVTGWVRQWTHPGGYVEQVDYVEFSTPWVALNTAGYLWSDTCK